MIADVIVPNDLWDAPGEGALSAWLYEDGSIVEAGTLIAEISYEKSSFELRAPEGGRLEIIVPAETPVAKGERVAVISR